MIHDAKVEVTCDGKGCRESVLYEPQYVYRSRTGEGGHYDCDDAKIVEWLGTDEEWRVVGDKHYCCAACVPGRLD